MTRAAILALLLLCAPAFAGKTELVKTPACVPGVVVVKGEPDLLVVGQPINVFKALAEMKARCKTPGRKRMADGRCWVPRTWERVMGE